MLRRQGRISAVKKRDGARAPEVKRLDKALGSQFPAGAMLIASPLAVAEAVEQVPAGRVITMGGLRAQLAARYGAEYTCPLTTGIFLRIAAEAAVEEGDGGRQSRVRSDSPVPRPRIAISYRPDPCVRRIFCACWESLSIFWIGMGARSSKPCLTSWTSGMDRL